jgi:hypothetical protein
MKTRTTIPALLTISIDRSRVARPLRLIRLGKLLLIGAVFMGGVSGAAADNPERLASMVEQMRTGKTELSTLKGQEDDLTAQNESSLKEVAAYQSSFGQLESEKKAKLENSPVIKDAKRRLKSADDMVEEWNTVTRGHLQRGVEEKGASRARRGCHPHGCATQPREFSANGNSSDRGDSSASAESDRGANGAYQGQLRNLGKAESKERRIGKEATSLADKFSGRMHGRVDN